MRPPQIPHSRFYWLTALAATFLLGWWAGSRSGEPQSSPSVEASSPSPGPDRNRISALKGERRPVERVTFDLGDGIEAVAKERLIRPAASEELEQYLRSGLASTDLIYRDLVLSQVLSQLSAENAPVLAAAFRGMRYKGADNLSIHGRFVTRWAELDGASAMAYARSSDEEWGSEYSMKDAKELIEKVVGKWAEGDSEACLAYLDDQGMVELYLLPYLRGAATATSSPEVFEAYVAEIEDQALRRSAIFAVADGLRDKPGAVLDWADRAMNMESPDPTYVKQVLLQILFKVNDGRVLAEWIDRNSASPWLNPDDPHLDAGFTVPGLYVQAAAQWAKTDALAALNWATQNASDPRMPDSIFDTVMEQWRETDGPGNIAWVTQNLGDPRTTYRQVDGAVGEWARTDPAAAAEWVARNISSDKVTGGACSELVERWIPSAPDEALDWVRSLPDDFQQFALVAAASAWPRQRLDEFMPQVLSEGNSPHFDWARMTLARRYIDVDVDAALSLPGTMVDPEYRERSMVKIAELVMESDPAAAKEWLADSGLSDEMQRRIMRRDPF